MGLLADALHKMTKVEEMNFKWLSLMPDACDILMEALLANQAINPALRKIDLSWVAGKQNRRMSDASKQHIDTLRTFGI